MAVAFWGRTACERLKIPANVKRSRRGVRNTERLLQPLRTRRPAVHAITAVKVALMALAVGLSDRALIGSRDRGEAAAGGTGKITSLRPLP